jgi:N-acetylglutamate synthase-like GNAT family acetyltransferase
MAVEYLESTIVLPDCKDRDLAEQVSGWMETSNMLRKTPEQLLKSFAKGWSVLVVAAESRMVVAHAAINYDWGGWIETGGAVTKPGECNKGYGTAVMKASLQRAGELYPEKGVFALCNSKSLPIRLKLGGMIMDPNRLPNEVWGECINCPSFKAARAAGKHCCDTPVLLKEPKL